MKKNLVISILLRIFVCCVQSPKKFGWKFWILILQKSEKFGAEIWQKLFWKKYSEKYFSQNKIEKINAWKICSWKSSNCKNLLFIIEKNRTKLFKKQPKIFFRKWKWRSFDKFAWKYLKKLLKNGKLRCTQQYIGKMRAWILHWICEIFFRRCFSYCFFI